jgi:hypothetical protein
MGSYPRVLFRAEAARKQLASGKSGLHGAESTHCARCADGNVWQIGYRGNKRSGTDLSSMKPG